MSGFPAERFVGAGPTAVTPHPRCPHITAPAQQMLVRLGKAESRCVTAISGQIVHIISPGTFRLFHRFSTVFPPVLHSAPFGKTKASPAISFPILPPCPMPPRSRTKFRRPLHSPAEPWLGCCTISSPVRIFGSGRLNTPLPPDSPANRLLRRPAPCLPARKLLLSALPPRETGPALLQRHPGPPHASTPPIPRFPPNHTPPSAPPLLTHRIPKSLRVSAPRFVAPHGGPWDSWASAQSESPPCIPR
jgi:hypothetical protein